MKRQPPLGRSAVIARLRERGAVSPAWLAAHDREVLCSTRMHFSSFEAARRGARVP
jgi:hypothetical protein